MRGAPRGENASRSEPQRARTKRGNAFARSARLRKPEEFGALAGEGATWRAARQLVAMSARVDTGVDALRARSSSGESVKQKAPASGVEPDGFQVRFGFTVGRRQARRAVQRTLVKRVLREAARHAAGPLGTLAQGRPVDVVLRLRSALPAASEMTLDRLKRALRSEADSLFAQLAHYLGGADRSRHLPDHRSTAR